MKYSYFTHNIQLNEKQWIAIFYAVESKMLLANEEEEMFYKEILDEIHKIIQTIRKNHYDQ